MTVDEANAILWRAWQAGAFEKAETRSMDVFARLVATADMVKIASDLLGVSVPWTCLRWRGGTPYISVAGVVGHADFMANLEAA